MPAPELPSAQTMQDIGGCHYVQLEYGATVTAARKSVPAGGIGLLSSADRRLPIGIVSSERLEQPGEVADGDLLALADAALLAAADLPLDRAFRIMLAHPELRWVAVEGREPDRPIHGLIARHQLVPAALERFQGTAMDRVGLPGDPILPASGLSYRCQEDPDGHVFTAVQIENWTAELRAICPVDGTIMTAYVAVVRDCGGS